MRAKFVYEAIKHLKPRSEEEIKSNLKNLSPQEKLRTGTKEGILWLVKDALDNGVDVHTSDDYALRVAAFDGQIELVKLLLDAGANPYAAHDLFPTNNAFYWAEQSNKLEKHEILELLKQYKKEK